MVRWHFAPIQASPSQRGTALATGSRICQTNSQRDRDLDCPPSRPTRGAWIETATEFRKRCNDLVAPHTGRDAFSPITDNSWPDGAFLLLWKGVGTPLAYVAAV